MISILLPTDFSNIARNAILQSLSLFGAGHNKINLTLLNAYLVQSVDREKAVHISDQTKQRALELLLSEKSKIADLTPDYKINFDTFVHMGSVENIIPEIIKVQKIDLLVMGKNSGDFIEKVCRGLKESNCSCPLIIV